MKELYDHYYEKLKFTAYRELHSKVNAEDVASNVLKSIFVNAANYDYIEKPNAWLYKSVKNATMNFKKQNSKYVYTEFIDDTYAAKDAKTEFKIDLMRCLEQLSEIQQEIVELHFLYGCPINETAKSLNISVSTVNRQINLLRSKLKKLI